MTIKLNDTELQELAAQLRHPSGKSGVTIADNMNENNIKMTESSILELNLKQNEQVLELGHGNCGHLNFLLQQATNIGYVGLEISELMQQEAIKFNKKHSNSDIRFELFDGKTIYQAAVKEVTPVIDRVGSGDAFMGGLIYGLLEYKNNNQRALDFAVAACCLKHTIAGDYNLVTLKEVENMVDGDSAGLVSR